MKCPNCGAEIVSSNTCEYCGAQISLDMKKEQEQLNKQGCPKCGSSNVKFTRENHGEIRGKNSKKIVHRTVGFCQDCGHTWYPGSVANETPKKRKTWLWVLGWLCIFPLPLTILLLRKKDMKSILKYGIIAAAWLIYIIIGVGGNSDSNKNTVVEETVTEEPIAKEADNTEADIMIVTLQVEPNVNSEDGSVLFGVTTNLPEGTELMLTLFNDNGYTAQDKVVILANSSGYTAEFSENGAALSGKYTAQVTMSLPKLQAESVRAVIGENGEKIGGEYVKKSSIGDSNIVTGEFEFEF